jgi:hypothetical protein
VAEERWRVEVTRRGLTLMSALLPEVAGTRDDLDDWIDGEDIPDGVPFLISPGLEYDVDLNQYFLSPAMVGSSRNTQLAAAGEVRRFLDFLWCSRGGRGWRDAAEADHDAYWYWRRQDPAGPRVAGSTWNRELSTPPASSVTVPAGQQAQAKVPGKHKRKVTLDPGDHCGHSGQHGGRYRIDRGNAELATYTPGTAWDQAQRGAQSRRYTWEASESTTPGNSSSQDSFPSAMTVLRTWSGMSRLKPPA